MAFTRVNPLGWALFEELTSAQMNQLDLRGLDAIDGVDGGTYPLNNPLTLQGTVNIDDLNVTNDASIGNDLTVDNDFGVLGETSLNNLFVDGVVKGLGEKYVRVVDNSDLYANDQSGTAFTANPTADGMKQYFDASGCDFHAGCWIQVLFTGTPWQDGQELIIELKQSSTLHACVRGINFSASTLANIFQAGATDINEADPRTNVVTRWSFEFDANSGPFGIWQLKSKTVSSPAVADLNDANSSGYSSFIGQGFQPAASIGLDPTPRKTLAALISPKSVVSTYTNDPDTFPTKNVPISRLVYSPAGRCLLAICRDSDLTTTSRSLCYSYDGYTWKTLLALSATNDNATKGVIAIIPDINGDKTEDRVYAGTEISDAAQTYAVGDIGFGGAGTHGEPTYSAGAGASIASVSARRAIHNGNRFYTATNFALYGKSEGQPVNGVAINEPIQDVCVAPDGRMMAIADDADVWFSPAPGAGSESFSEVNTATLSGAVTGIAYGWRSDAWVVLMDNGNVWVSTNNGTTWNNVIPDSLILTPNVAMQIQGVGGCVVIATGRSQENTTSAFLVAADPTSSSGWFRQSYTGNATHFNAGMAWLQGRLIIPSWQFPDTDQIGQPEMWASLPVGDFGPDDFDR